MSHVDAQLDTVVVAYDIDGTLTTEEGRKEFLEDADTKKVIPGILSARTSRGINDFIVSHPDIGSRSEFMESATFKVGALRKVKERYPNADRYIYKGSWTRDRIASLVAGWEYEQI